MYSRLEAALTTFVKARPPGIYKQEYLDELCRRYGSSGESVSAPPRPDWCFEETEEVKPGVSRKRGRERQNDVSIVLSHNMMQQHGLSKARIEISFIHMLNVGDTLPP